MATDISQESLSWLGTWRLAFLHPTVKTFRRIMSDPKASVGRGIVWAAIAACLVWLLSPLRSLAWALAAQNFGIMSPWPVAAVGVVMAALWGISTLLLDAFIGHGLARLLHGTGTFARLVYCWGVTQLPFWLVVALVLAIPTFRYSPAVPISPVQVIMTFSKFAVVAALLLYLAYAQVVAFAAVEGFSVWKGLGALVVLSIMLAIISACASVGLRGLLASAYSY